MGRSSKPSLGVGVHLHGDREDASGGQTQPAWPSGHVAHLWVLANVTTICQALQPPTKTTDCQSLLRSRLSKPLIATAYRLQGSALLAVQSLVKLD